MATMPKLPELPNFNSAPREKSRDARADTRLPMPKPSFRRYTKRPAKKAKAKTAPRNPLQDPLSEIGKKEHERLTVPACERGVQLPRRAKDNSPGEFHMCLINLGTKRNPRLVIVQDNDKEEKGPPMWKFPSGWRQVPGDPGSPQAAERECEEEVGLDLPVRREISREFSADGKCLRCAWEMDADTKVSRGDIKKGDEIARIAIVSWARFEFLVRRQKVLPNHANMGYRWRRMTQEESSN